MPRLANTYSLMRSLAAASTWMIQQDGLLEVQASPLPGQGWATMALPRPEVSNWQRPACVCVRACSCVCVSVCV